MYERGCHNEWHEHASCQDEGQGFYLPFNANVELYQGMCLSYLENDKYATNICKITMVNF